MPQDYPTREEASASAARWLWWWWQTHKKECPTPSALARRAGISKASISQMFASGTRGVGFDNLLAIWRLVGGSLDAVVRGQTPELPEGATAFPAALTHGPPPATRRSAHQ